MLILKSVSLFDGDQLLEGTFDILIEKSKIKAIVPEGNKIDIKGARSIELKGTLACPGFIDIHAHLREPGEEWREDIESGSLAGARGGFTTIVAMPNTSPPLDRPELIRHIARKGREVRGAKVLPSGAISKNREGKELAELFGMAKEGAVLFTEDGSPTSNTELLRNALLYTKDLNLKIMEHPEDPYLSNGGQINEGKISALSGLKGIPRSSELIGVERCIALAEELRSPIHITHVSTKESISAIRSAKERGIPITCDTTPHHLSLEESEIIKSDFNPVYKVKPPLRTLEDIEALWEAISDGIIDAIATDHAPYHPDEKDLPFEEAPFGIASLECAVAVVLNEWHNRKQKISIERILRLFTSGPSRILPERYRELGKLKEGGIANITVLDLEKIKKVNASSWVSKCRLTPWDGITLKGWPILTIVEGEVFQIDI
ncbi:MAG: dihydroorotase [Synergistetes bacterium]|nr:dihydroorotase [Synergistota bacterium]